MGDEKQDWYSVRPWVRSVLKVVGVGVLLLIALTVLIAIGMGLATMPRQ